MPLDDATLAALAEAAEEDVPAQDARLETLRACLAKLTGRQREVLRQRYEESLPVAVIAESAQRTPMAVYKAIKQAHLALFDCVTRTLGPSAR